MLNVNLISGNTDQQFTFSDFFSHRSNNFILMTECYDHLPLYQSINRSILQQILTLGFDQNKEVQDEDLQEFFRQLNWQVSANLQRMHVNAEGKSIEPGISLLFVLFRENRLTVVQFGRILCGIVSEGTKIEIGHTWENFSIKSREALNLLGYNADNIPVKLHHHTLEPGQSFVAFSSKHAQKISQTQPKPKLWQMLLAEINDLHCIVENPKRYSYHSSFFRRLKPFQITAIILIMVIATTIVYWFWGRNQVESHLVSLKERYRELERNTDPERTPELLGDLIQSVFPYADSASIGEIELNIRHTMEITNRLVQGPMDEIGISRDWTRKMDGSSSIIPIFDSRAIYYGYSKNVCAIDKSSRKELWKYEADSTIRQLILTDGNRMMVATKSGKLFSLNRSNGEMEWVSTNVSIDPKASALPVHLDFVQDRRLVSSVLLYIENKQLVLMDCRDGKQIAEMDITSDSIQISDYDVIEKCWYIVEIDKLSKIRFDVF